MKSNWLVSGSLNLFWRTIAELLTLQTGQPRARWLPKLLVTSWSQVEVWQATSLKPLALELALVAIISSLSVEATATANDVWPQVTIKASWLSWTRNWIFNFKMKAKMGRLIRGISGALWVELRIGNLINWMITLQKSQPLKMCRQWRSRNNRFIRIHHLDHKQTAVHTPKLTAVDQPPTPLRVELDQPPIPSFLRTQATPSTSRLSNLFKNTKMWTPWQTNRRNSFWIKLITALTMDKKKD